MSLSTEEIYKDLLKWQILVFSNIEQTIKSEEKNQYVQWIGTTHNGLSFKIGSQSYVLEYMINPYAELIKYKTYELILNYDNFPNKKIVELENFEMSTSIDCSSIINGKKCSVNNFAATYINQLNDVIKNKMSNI